MQMRADIEFSSATRTHRQSAPELGRDTIDALARTTYLTAPEAVLAVAPFLCTGQWHRDPRADASENPEQHTQGTKRYLAIALTGHRRHKLEIADLVAVRIGATPCVGRSSTQLSGTRPLSVENKSGDTDLNLGSTAARNECSQVSDRGGLMPKLQVHQWQARSVRIRPAHCR